MSTPSIYGEYARYLPKILQEITDPIIAANITSKKKQALNSMNILFHESKKAILCVKSVLGKFA